MAGFLMGLSAGAQAADLLDTVTQRGTLQIALEGSYPPFNFKENGQLTGFEVALAPALAQKLGVKAEFSTSEWSAMLAGLQAGRYDVGNQPGQHHRQTQGELWLFRALHPAKPTVDRAERRNTII